MRTTINLDPDIAAAVEQLRRDGVGASEAVNKLARRGLAGEQRVAGGDFAQPTFPLGIRVNIDNVAEILERLDEAEE